MSHYLKCAASFFFFLWKKLMALQIFCTLICILLFDRTFKFRNDSAKLECKLQRVCKSLNMMTLYTSVLRFWCIHLCRTMYSDVFLPLSTVFCRYFFFFTFGVKKYSSSLFAIHNSHSLVLNLACVHFHFSLKIKVWKELVSVLDFVTISHADEQLML